MQLRKQTLVLKQLFLVLEELLLSASLGRVSSLELLLVNSLDATQITHQPVVPLRK